MLGDWPMGFSSVISMSLSSDALHRTRCMRMDRCRSFALSCSCSAACMRTTALSCNMLVACMQIVALHSLDCRACMLLDAVHLNRWRGHAREFWDRFGIVRRTRGVDIFGFVSVGMCPRDLTRENH